MLTEILLGVIIVLLVILIFLLFKRGEVDPRDIENAVFRVWKESGLNDKVGELSTHAKEIKETHKSIEQMLRVPKERAALGEIALETILSDQLPPEMLGIRKEIFDGKSPDAHIRSTVGIICIDSKFVLDNYRKMVESDDLQQKESFKKQFLKDLRGHLDKIKNDYVCPEKGTADFAFAYIPSEGVYWFLVNEAFDVLRDYAKNGVQVVSPLTLSSKIELIKSGVHAKKLSEEAEKIANELRELSKKFEAVDKVWKVFYDTHFKNAVNKADEVEKAYKELREEFNKISNYHSE